MRAGHGTTFEPWPRIHIGGDSLAPLLRARVGSLFGAYVTDIGVTSMTASAIEATRHSCERA